MISFSFSFDSTRNGSKDGRLRVEVRWGEGGNKEEPEDMTREKEEDRAHLRLSNLKLIHRLGCNPSFPFHKFSLDELDGSSLNAYDSE